MKARRLDTRSMLPFWNQEIAPSSQRWKTLAELFNDCSSLSVPETPSWLDTWRNLWDLKPENEGGNLFPFDAVIDGRVEPQLLWCRKLPIFAFSHFFIWTLQERVVVALVGFIVVVEEIYASVACDFGDIWAYNVCFLQLADCCFSCTMIRNFFLTYFKASTSYGLFSLCYLWYFRPLV